jgi:hypothetical protein
VSDKYFKFCRTPLLKTSLQLSSEFLVASRNVAANGTTTHLVGTCSNLRVSVVPRMGQYSGGEGSGGVLSSPEQLFSLFFNTSRLLIYRRHNKYPMNLLSKSCVRNSCYIVAFTIQIIRQKFMLHKSCVRNPCYCVAFTIQIIVRNSCYCVAFTIQIMVRNSCYIVELTTQITCHKFIHVTLLHFLSKS